MDGRYMNRKRRKLSILNMFLFVIGLVIYLTGLLLLFGAGISRTKIASILFANINITTKLINTLKTTGLILFVIGFIVFLIAVIFLYKNDKIQENNTNLIIEGKADVITLIVMTYVMMFMMVICLVYNELIGALLFGIAVVVQSIVNSSLIWYFSKHRLK